MQIDWLTVGAQWINFLILMWLLRRFLYQPIIQAMDKRQKAIASRNLEAQQQAEQAEQLAEEFRNKLAEMEKQRAELINTARQQAATERETLLQQARSESQELASRWRLEIEQEKALFQNELSRELGNLVLATARRAVIDLTGQQWEQALFGRFLHNLQHLPEQQKDQLTATAANGLAMASSFELDDAMRKRLCTVLNLPLNGMNDIRFESLPYGQSGLKLSSSGYSVEWTIENYFAQLKTELDAMLTRASSSQEP
ncbi:MAG: F0F1 ATP synthase subunit B [Gammaproteobacteria bacterium]